MQKIELLLATDIGNDVYEIVGVTYSNALTPNSNTIPLRATLHTILKVKELLAEGKHVYVSKNINYSEVLPTELIVEDEKNVLALTKQAAKNSIAALMGQTIFGISLLDAMDFLYNYMKLLNSGIFITNENREDKYFEIIENAQNTEQPKPLQENSTFEDEQNYQQQLQKYNAAQDNLSTLEKYLNAYDKISKIQFIRDLLADTSSKIDAAETTKDINAILTEYENKLKMFNE